MLDNNSVYVFSHFGHFFRLLVSYSLNRVELCGLLSRIPTEEHTSECTNGKAHYYAPRLDVDRPVGYQLYGIRRSNSQCHTYQTTRYT